MIAALFVRADGYYANRPDIDLWTEERDARLYKGPLPVVAHPPCARWGRLHAMHGRKLGDDDGCFESALASVRRWGGVLEHPAETAAWRAFGLPTPIAGAWLRQMGSDLWSTEVDQGVYGHVARKRTWLLYRGNGGHPPALDWSTAGVGRRVASGRCGVEIMSKRQRELTPPAFADTLINLARSAGAP